ncbi:MAG: type IV pilin [Euryarchaeota archaeon]|nr:type IV pilin [Euryarchaeota archaeon]
MLPRLQKTNDSPSRRNRLRRTLRDDARAASDVVGSILLVAVTVLMVGGLAAALAARPGPIENRYADLAVVIVQGSGDWGTGDERIEIRHRGGEPFFPQDTRIRYKIASTETTLTGDQLGSAFGDGVFQIGETWARTVTIPVQTNVDVGVVAMEAQSESLVSTNLLAASCNGDLTAPYVQSWTQSPVDVKSTTAGAVSVTALVSDACSGVDQTFTPNLYYRINDGTNPAYTNAGAMTLTATSTWQGSVPSQTWSSLVGKTLQYYIGPIRDVRLNQGDSAVSADAIQTDCGSDNQAPTVQTWTQNPADVTASTTGAVSVTAVLTDNCAGVDNGANPELNYRITSSGDPNPPFTNAGPMSRTATDTWRRSIPDQNWASQSGNTLEYELRVMKDLNGNTGTSTRQSDVIASSCAGDTQAPTVQTWTQSPNDVSSGTVGAVTITAVLTDNCAGVDNAANPELHYRVNDGTNPAFTNGGAMTLTGANTWQKAIPDQGWSSQGGKTLEYELRLMKDLNGNTGTSTRQSDAIQLVTVYTYVNSNTPTTGTVTNFGNAQSASDADAVATVAEGNIGGGGGSTNTYAATAVVSAGSWSNGNNGLTSDNVYATTTAQNTFIEYSLADQTGSPGTITAVVLKGEASLSPYVDDQFQLQACLAGGTCNTITSGLSGSGSDVTIQYDITNARPGGGSWSWTDVNNLQGRVQTLKIGAFDGTWRLDRVWAEVTYSGPAAYSTDVQMDFAGVPSGTTQVLELRYRTTGDTFNVQVWDGSAYRTCTGILNSAALATYTCSLTLPAEYQSGSPRIRFTDTTVGGATQGNLFLEYVRVKTN